ncbi:hypothetical protein L218DRAFT_843039, partial [Marasmius fiardii PR-910]
MQRIDDTDPRIVYTGFWFRGGVPLAEYENTTHGANLAGAQMTFRFKGTKVDVYGTVTSNLATKSNLDYFTLDDREPVEWSVPPQQSPDYGTLMYSSPNLEDGTHVLTLDVTVNQSD